MQQKKEILSKERLSQLKATARNLILDMNDANELFAHIEALQSELERKSSRLSEYTSGWSRQQGIIDSLSTSLLSQEVMALNNLKDKFTNKGFLNSIQPDELEDYIQSMSNL